MDPNYYVILDRPSLKTKLSLLKLLQEFRIPVNGKRYTSLRQNGKTPPDTGVRRIEEITRWQEIPLRTSRRIFDA